MKFTLSWLKDFLDTDAGVDEIAERLTAIGLEIEEVVDPVAAVKDLIVVSVDECVPHPDSDHLHVLKVNTGKEVLQIVCGAPNARAGMKGILARPGDYVPAFGDKLKAGKIRGVESCGMMCAEDELGVGPDHAGIIECPENAVVGASIATVYPSDPVFDVSITPNRGDCMSVYGIARDLAAAGLGTLKTPKREAVAPAFKTGVKLVNEAVDIGAPFFTLREIRNVKNAQSPKWLQDRLTAVGLRPISALVDVTNYFNITFGRPLHVFDADKVKGQITVRSARDGEKLLALDGKEYALSDGMVVIADENGVESIAGIMGGEVSGCEETTTRVLLESAYFDPESIAKTGQKLILTSDSRQRFERGVDPASTIPVGAEMAARMIMELCGGECSDIVVTGKEPAAPAPIFFDPKRVEKLCGVDVPADTCKEILEKLGCFVKPESNGFSVIHPTWRSDISGSHDLVEEVLRIYGYDKLPEIALPRPNGVHGILQPKQRREVSVRRAMANRGGCQTITWSFMSSRDAEPFRTGDAVLIANPISADLNEMRPNLLPNLLSAARSNIAKGTFDGCLFEVGPQFFGFKPMEQETVACQLRFGQVTPRHWAVAQRPVDVFDAKADALSALDAAEAPQNVQIAREAPAWYHPGRSGAVKIGKTVLAYFGELHPKVLKAMDLKTPVCACEVFLDRLPPAKKKNGKGVKTLKLSAFTPIFRDLAFLVDRKVDAEKIVSAAKNTDKALIADVSVFDLYEGENLGDKKSIAIQLTIQPVEKTMTDEEIESVCRRVVGAVAAATGATLRG
ncbi:MAG TPA: phenylalanine--tRNA ligase subunit beta [Alphaproteobacteria bacterium]|nr:phenylalanine--tRNA ligase subunit beta [Alphaproteobacteria bacterium]